MVHEEYASRSLALGVGERADVNALRAAVHSVGPRVSSAVGKLVGLVRISFGWAGSGFVSNTWRREDRMPGTIR